MSLPEIKIAFTAVHICQHPVDNFICEVLVFLTLVREEANCLCWRMDIYGIDSIMIILRCACFFKDCVSVIFIMKVMPFF